MTFVGGAAGFTDSDVLFSLSLTLVLAFSCWCSAMLPIPEPLPAGLRSSLVALAPKQSDSSPACPTSTRAVLHRCRLLLSPLSNSTRG